MSEELDRPVAPCKGRGAVSSPDCRYDATRREPVDDGWGPRDPEISRLETTVAVDASRSIVARNRSPDVPFEQSINPYRGCEHGCIYCYARPTHAHLGLSPGLDFETRLFAKPEAARLLKKELARPGYRCRPLAMGTNTDPYQPVEKRWRITREVLEVLSDCHHPVSLVTKSSLIERDLDLLADLAARGLVEAYVSITTLDRRIARGMEPRAAAPQRRLRTLRTLSEAGVPTGALVAPVIPGLTDVELDAVLQESAEAGAQRAAYILLRLPLEVKELFQQWLEVHHPLKAKAVMSRVRETRGGRENDARFDHRMRGRGEYAAVIRKRFELACRRLGLNQSEIALDATRFQPPIEVNAQLNLF